MVRRHICYVLVKAPAVLQAGQGIRVIEDDQVPVPADQGGNEEGDHGHHPRKAPEEQPVCQRDLGEQREMPPLSVNGLRHLHPAGFLFQAADKDFFIVHSCCQPVAVPQLVDGVEGRLPQDVLHVADDDGKAPEGAGIPFFQVYRLTDSKTEAALLQVERPGHICLSRPFRLIGLRLPVRIRKEVDFSGLIPLLRIDVCDHAVRCQLDTAKKVVLFIYGLCQRVEIHDFALVNDNDIRKGFRHRSAGIDGPEKGIQLGLPVRHGIPVPVHPLGIGKAVCHNIRNHKADEKDRNIEQLPVFFFCAVFSFFLSWQLPRLSTMKQTVINVIIICRFQ